MDGGSDTDGFRAPEKGTSLSHYTEFLNETVVVPTPDGLPGDLKVGSDFVSRLPAGFAEAGKAVLQVMGPP